MRAFKIKMASEELDIEGIFKLKVDGLKLELGKRSLSKSGTKAELQERLLNHFTTNDVVSDTIDTSKAFDNDTLEDTTEDEELKNELEASLDKLDTPTALTADENQKKLLVDADTPVEDKIQEDTKEVPVATEAPAPEIPTKNSDNDQTVSENKPETKTINVGTKPLTATEKIEQRSKRFGANVSETEKKKARMERFGVDAKNGDSMDKRKQRAARFGTASTTDSTSGQSGGSDKLKQRQDRFLDDKIKKRQERFGVVQPTVPTSSSLETRKQQRALKFGIK